MIRIGVDFGGTKIEAAALDRNGRFVARRRAPTPPAYEDRLEVTRRLVTEVEQQVGERAPVLGVGGPGALSPSTGLVRNANSAGLNGRALPVDLAEVLERPVRYANDANCLALSEATDGAGAGCGVVFGVIIGTGCGGGIVVGGRLLEGRNGAAGEWGHAPLPWPRPEEYPGPRCGCGGRGCLEQWLSGPAFARHAGRSGEAAAAAAEQGDGEAIALIDVYADRLARGLAMVVDVLDPDVIVLGGGMSNIARLYEILPQMIERHVFSDVFETPVVKALHGDSSGVRGAAWLWPLEPEE
ncbi:MAG: ROK family protein [Caulobacterales bacterium]|nr:ROK family protein [Caulobacterales bacterium]